MTGTIESFIKHAAAEEMAREQERAQARAELALMSKAMIQEEGLLNHCQAALLLGVSVKRVGELVRRGKFTRFDFLGRTYVSVREVRKRDEEALVSGDRTKRSIAERVIGSVKAALKTDSLQAKLGGYAGPYHKDKAGKKRGKADAK